MSYLTLIVLTLIIGLAATGYVNGQLKKYSKVGYSGGITGAEAARRMLSYYGIRNVDVVAGGQGQDFFDPRTNRITLSPQAYGVSTVTAIATACHEAGHACQYAQDYTPMKVRGAMVPAVNLCSNGWFIVLIVGIALNLAGLQLLAIILYAAVVLFELVTLPVEFDASHRATTYLATIGASADAQSGAKKVLTSCALTYVAAALTSILQLLWIIGQTRD